MLPVYTTVVNFAFKMIQFVASYLFYTANLSTVLFFTLKKEAVFSLYIAQVLSDYTI
jgi:hypothetical protein